MLRNETMVHSDQNHVVVRATARRFSALMPVFLAWITACRDNTGLRPSAVDSLPNISGLIVSAPVRRPAPLGATPAQAPRASADESAASASLAPSPPPPAP